MMEEGRVSGRAILSGSSCLPLGGPFLAAPFPVQESTVSKETVWGPSFLHSNPRSCPYLKSLKFTPGLSFLIWATWKVLVTPTR